MSDDPKPGTYGALTRSTEEEHRAFMHALKGLTFTKQEFIEHGPAIVLKKSFAVLDELGKLEKSGKS